MNTATHRGLKSSLALRLWALAMTLMLSFGVSAQTAPSADAAISVAEQWLTLADADQGGAMWDQSFTFMKEKVDRPFWINHVATKTSTLGQRTAPRVWSVMEHDINKPGIPPANTPASCLSPLFPRAVAGKKSACIGTKTGGFPWATCTALFSPAHNPRQVEPDAPSL